MRSHGFVLSRTHDIKATLAAKGFNIQPLRVFEVVMRPDTGEPSTPERDLVNVCRLHIYVEDGVVHVTAIRPTAMSKIFSDRAARAEAAALEDSVVRLVDEVVNW
ncbi:MAG: hypothetical protein U1F44_03250 [Coriobacteriia bacterium]|nr:hypothetical protein [Coriobacteriia bacterium]